MEAAVSITFQRALEAHRPTAASAHPGGTTGNRAVLDAWTKRSVQGLRESRASYGEELKSRWHVECGNAGGVLQMHCECRRPSRRLGCARNWPFGSTKRRYYPSAKRELAGISKWAFHVLLGNEGVTRVTISKNCGKI